MQQLTGTSLTLALSRTTAPIELKDLQGERVALFADAEQPRCATIPLVELFAYIARGYEVFGSKRRARYIAPPRPKVRTKVDQRIFVSDPTFWAGRGCIRFWKDQRSPAGIAAAAQ